MGGWCHGELLHFKFDHYINDCVFPLWNKVVIIRSVVYRVGVVCYHRVQEETLFGVRTLVVVAQYCQLFQRGIFLSAFAGDIRN